MPTFCPFLPQLSTIITSRCIRVWDCNSEARLTDIPTASESFVTSLALSPSHHPMYPVMAAAFGDGVIKLFDHRLPRKEIMSYREHGQFVLSCRVQAGGKLVSGCTDGLVKVSSSHLTGSGQG